MRVDLENAKGGVLPEGEHVFRIADASDQVSKKGNEMLVLDLVVVTDDFKGAEARDWVVPQFFPEKFTDLLLSTNVPIPTPGTDFDVSVLNDKHVRAIVYHDTYETAAGLEKTGAKISGYRPLQQGDPLPEDVPTGATSSDTPF